MRISSSARYALGVCAVVVLLADCSSGASMPIGSSLGVTPSLPGLAPNWPWKHPPNHGRLPNVFVADEGNNAVKEILSAGHYRRVLTLGSGFNAPNGVAVDAKGDVFVADTGNNAVKEMLAVGGAVRWNPIIKTLTSAITTPYNVALDRYNNLFVTNNGASVVYELLAPGYTTINTLGSFLFPTSVAVDRSDNVYVGTAASTSEVFEMLAPGYTTVNTLGGGYGEFLNPYGLAADASGNVFVGDFNNSAIKMMPPNCFSTSCVTTLTSQFYRPTGVAVDWSDNVYGCDYASGEVFVILKAGGYKTIKALGSGFVHPWQIAIH
jgi:NHL repeat